jgi:DNA mismatch endonuclease (patch repair protein)
MHRLGLRYRLHPKGLPGRPDIALTRAKIAIFVDGCFWHGCPTHGTAPKNNSDWWRTKIKGNAARDRAKDQALEAMGWAAVHVWEHENATEVAGQIHRLWLAQRAIHK